jgi:MerR family transcriptional regulator, light-induced transcriptional regulator
VRTLKTSEAAALLNVSPNTLRAWERRFGYPKPQRSPGRHRLYTHAEIAALRDALHEGLSISSAISQARSALRGDTAVLVGALSAFELERADAAMESALALRSVERTVEEVLLPTLNELGDRHGADSAPWAFAARWAADWLHRAQRLTPAPERGISIIVGDATRDELDPEDLHIRALQLFLTRAGARVLVLPVSGLSGLGELVTAFAPDAVVIGGGHDQGDAVARWAYAVRSSAGPLPVALFHRATGRVRTTGARVLPEQPSEAARELVSLVESGATQDNAPMPIPEPQSAPMREAHRRAS